MTDLKKNIEQSLKLLFRVEKQSSKKKILLDKPKMIYLQIGLFKVPFVPAPIKKYLKLRYSLYGAEPEVCLFVPNRKTGVEYKKTTDEFVDFCVDYYTELLDKHKIKGISTVMPLKQLRAEYGEYEMRRKLVRRYDLFLCKNSLLYNPRFVTALGKIFKDASREPLGVAFPKEDSDFDPEFQKNIDRAIFTSSFVINRASDNYTIPFGSLSNTKSELKENLEMVLDQLISEKMIPGGIQNVRALYLWPSQSKPIPLFINPELPSKEQKFRVKSDKKRKRPIGVEDELSTQPGKKVVVMPSGEVFVTKIKKRLKVESEKENKTAKEESCEKPTKSRIKKEESADKSVNKDSVKAKKRKILKTGSGKVLSKQKLKTKEKIKEKKKSKQIDV